MFEGKVYAARRAKLKQKIGSGIILLLGNEESSINYSSNHYHFRQDSTFLYYFGLDLPHLAAVIDIDEDKTIIFGQEWTMDDIIWMGDQPSLQSLANRVAVQEVQAYDKLLTYLQATKQDIHYLPPYRPENKIKLAQLLGITIPEVAQGFSKTLIKAIVEQASIKEAIEVVEIEKAVNITASMHLSVMKSARAGMKEVALRGVAEGIAIAGGGHLSFPIILTVNGQVLHNHYHGNTLQNGHLLLMDMGAETARHYAGDITRTFPVNKKFTSRQKEVYNIVLDAQLKAIDAIKPEVNYKEIHLLAAQTITEGLQAIGLMKGDVAESVAAGAHALFFPHGLGHMLGLDVHDMEDYGEDFVGYDENTKRSTQFGLRSLRLGRKLQTGFVLTVEPGIYFIPQLINKWKNEGLYNDFIDYEKLNSYNDFGGIRIEDDVLVTENGARVLGNPIPKTVAEIEELRK